MKVCLHTLVRGKDTRVGKKELQRNMLPGGVTNFHSQVWHVAEADTVCLLIYQTEFTMKLFICTG